MKQSADKTTRTRSSAPRGLTSMSEGQLNAYLLTREALRRIKRSAALFDASAAARGQPVDERFSNRSSR